MTTQIENPPSQPAQPIDNGEEFHLVAVKISLPLPLDGHIPSGNRIGTSMLLFACQSALQHQNLLLENGTVGVGELNDSLYTFTVRKVAPALAALELVLTGCQLRPFSTLLVYHHQLFRPHGPDHAGIGIGFTLDELRRRNQEGIELHRKLLQQLRDLQASLAASRKVNNPPDGHAP